MPAGGIRVGGAYVSFTAEAGAYTRGVDQAIAANQRLGRSYAAIGRDLGRNSLLISQFGASLRSSLLATVAYAAGVGAVTAGLRGTVQGFIDYDRQLIQISKTTGIVGADLERLGERLTGIITQPVGENRAFGLLREQLFAIATAAGQAGIRTEEGITRITRASAALQLSSDLIGTQAVRALTRYLEVTGQSVDRTDAVASAITHLGNNIVGTESEISRFATRMAQNLSAVGEASDGLILGLASTLLEAGVEMEAAGSAIQRTQVAILRQAADASTFASLRQGFAGTGEELEALRQRFLSGTASTQDYDTALLSLLRTVRAQPAALRNSFVAQFIGGGEANVRNVRTLGVLANRMERLDRNVRVANEGLDDQNRHFEEAGRASDSYSSRLQVVGNRLLEQGEALGSVLVPALTAVAENFELLQAAAIAAGVAFARSFGRRQFASFAAGQAALRQESTAAGAALRAQATEVQRLQRQIAVSQAGRQFFRDSLVEERALRAALTQQTTAQAAAEARLAQASSAATAARAQVGRVQGALGAPVIDRDATRARQELARANADVARTTAQLQAIEQNRAVTGVTSTRDLRRARTAELALTRQLSEATARQNQLQAVAARQYTLTARAARAASAALGFFGGPLGLLTTALTFGASAWLLWGDSVEQAGDSIDDIIERLDDATEALARQERTATGNLLVQTEGRLASIGQQIGGLERQIAEAEAVASTPLFTRTPGGQDRGLARQQARDLQRDLDELRTEYDRLTTAADRFRRASGAPSGDTAAAVARADFEALPTSVLRATQAIDQFRASLRDQVQSNIASAQAELAAGRQSELTGRISLAVFRERERITARLVQANRQLADSDAQIAEAQERVSAATTERDNLPVGSQARAQAERQLTNEQRRLGTIEQQNDALQAQLQRLNRVRLDVEGIRQAEELRRRATIEDRLRQQPEAGQPDIRRAERDANEGLRALQLQQAQADQTAASNALALAEGDRAVAAARRARASVLADAAEQERQADEAVAITRERLAEATARRAAAEQAALAAGVQATDAQLDAVDASRQSVASLRTELAERTAAQAVIRGNADAYAELAQNAYDTAFAQIELERVTRETEEAFERMREEAERARMEFENRPLNSLARDARDLSLRLEEVATNGFNSLSDSITELVTRGKTDFASLANSIIADLVRVLVQAQIVAPIINALGGSGIFGGGGGGGGIGSILGLFGFHTGGEAPHAPQRLNRRAGLRSDEMMAVLQRGEIVLPRDLSRRLKAGQLDWTELRSFISRLPRFHTGGEAGGGSLASALASGAGLRVELVNRGAPQQVVDAGAEVRGRDIIVAVVTDDLRRGGPISRQIRGQTR